MVKFHTLSKPHQELPPRIIKMDVHLIELRDFFRRNTSLGTTQDVQDC